MPSAQTLGLGIALGCTFLTNANGTFQALQKRARAMLIRGILVFVERKTLLDAVSFACMTEDHCLYWPLPLERICAAKLESRGRDQRLC